MIEQFNVLAVADTKVLIEEQNAYTNVAGDKIVILQENEDIELDSRERARINEILSSNTDVFDPKGPLTPSYV